MASDKHTAQPPLSNTVIFAVPRHEYGSYQDLYRLIDLSGFPKVYIDEINPQSDNCYIVTILNGESQAGWVNPRARIILYDLEWHLDGVRVPGCEVWAGDAWYATQIGAKYVPMGSHPGLRLNADSLSSERYDVAYLGYMIPRRERIAHDLRERGVRVSPPHAWGEERHRVLSNSTAYLHVHQWDHVPTIAPLRMVVAAAYGLPVITEECADCGAFEPYVIREDYPYLVSKVQFVTQRPDLNTLWEDDANRLHRFLCEDLTFRKSIEAAL